MTPHVGARIVAAVVAATLTSVSLIAQGGTRLSTAQLETIVARGDVPVPARRVEAAGRLGQTHDRRAVAALTAALRDPDTGVQRAVALALGEIRDTAPVPALIDLLKTGHDTSGRSAAAFALGVIHDRRAVDPLIAALKDPDLDVRMNSAVALGRLGDPRAVEPLLPWNGGRHHARAGSEGADAVLERRGGGVARAHAHGGYGLA